VPNALVLPVPGGGLAPIAPLALGETRRPRGRDARVAFG
jgi:hypothetical protein